MAAVGLVAVRAAPVGVVALVAGGGLALGGYAAVVLRPASVRRVMLAARAT
jgi:hypothetical protein